MKKKKAPLEFQFMPEFVKKTLARLHYSFDMRWEKMLMNGASRVERNDWGEILLLLFSPENLKIWGHREVNGDAGGKVNEA